MFFYILKDIFIFLFWHREERFLKSFLIENKELSSMVNIMSTDDPAHKRHSIAHLWG